MALNPGMPVVIVTKIDHPGLEPYIKAGRDPVAEVLDFLHSDLLVQEAYPVASYRSANFAFNEATSTTTLAIIMQLVQNIAAYCGAHFAVNEPAKPAVPAVPVPATEVEEPATGNLWRQRCVSCGCTQGVEPEACVLTIPESPVGPVHVSDSCRSLCHCLSHSWCTCLVRCCVRLAGIL